VIFVKTPLPPPTGRFAVGRTRREWTDTTRVDPYAAEPSTPRSLVTWIWYPRSAVPEASAAVYVPPAWAPAAQILGVETAEMSTHSVDDAPLAADQAEYPVVLLSPSGYPPLLLAGIAEELASHGFVVVGVNHTYETLVTPFADGHSVGMNPAAIAGALDPQAGAFQEVFQRRADVCLYKAADLAFLADSLHDLDPRDRLAGRLDLRRISAMGHSFGGAAALQWCRHDARCKATINLDGALWTDVGQVGLPRPVMQLVGSHHEFDVQPEEAVKAGMAPDPQWFITERAITFDGWLTVDRTGQPAHSVVVNGANHLSFTDAPFLPPAPNSPTAALLAASDISPADMLTVTNTLVVGFLTGSDMPAVLNSAPISGKTSSLRHPAEAAGGQQHLQR
jgi:dienelactone hydrolase